MQLYCPDCKREIPAVNINIGTMVAKCDPCNSVFSFADKVPVSATGVGSRSYPPAVIYPQPPQMVLQDWPNDWSVTWRWFNWSYVPLAGFCVFWDGFLIAWYTIAFKTHGPLSMKLFPVLHLCAGVVLTYSVLTGFMNRTLIRISSSELWIRHSPLPWWGNRRFSSGEIRQLYCQRGSVSSKGNGPSYQLFAVLGEGKPLRLLGGFRYLAEAKFLEQQIEKRLRITPQPVVGECHE